MKDLPQTFPTESRRESRRVSADFQSLKKKDVRSQKEKDLARDIKLAVRADQWNKLPDLLADWELISSKDILVECGIQFLTKERAMCEKILLHVAKRGPLPGNEYPYASALIHLADCEFYLSKWENCMENLALGIKFIEKYARDVEIEQAEAAAAAKKAANTGAPAKEPQRKPKTYGPEWSDLKNWAAIFAGVMSFRQGKYQEALHMLDKTSNYEMVLQPGRFAFFTLLKAKCLLRLGLPDEAARTLNRRQSQEHALLEAAQMRREELPKGPSKIDKVQNIFSMEELGEAVDDAKEAASNQANITTCHDLHIILLVSMGRDEEAKDLFRSLKDDGSKRASSFSDFVKRCKLDDIGKSILEGWTANIGELMKRS